MKEVFEAIAEIETMLERQVEWGLTDHVEKREIDPYLTQAYNGLIGLKIMAEDVKRENQL
jgi:hypothetical protein